MLALKYNSLSGINSADAAPARKNANITADG